VAVGPGAAVAIPSAAKQIDCRGMVVVAGFWNSHVHFIQRKWSQAATLPASELAQQLQEMLTQHGFTTVFDTGSMWENTRALRQRVESGEVAGPAILTSGEILLPKGGQFPAEVMRTMGFMPLDFPELADAETARTRAKSMLESGVDALKIYAGTWMGPQVVMPVEMVRAIAEEAHRYNRLVIAHPSNLEGVCAALDGGADALVHTAPASGRWSNELVAEMKKRNMALIPTLKLWKYEARHDRILLRQMLTDAAVEQLRGFHQAGGTVLFGTDVGYMEDYDPIEEFALMARAGMDFRQILASLTSAPAERFGRATRKGELRPGMDADVVVLDGDPRKDVRAFARVKYTVRVGSVIFSAP
jgi:imidazolonepropionase-like amidohydrolase